MLGFFFYKRTRKKKTNEKNKEAKKWAYVGARTPGLFLKREPLYRLSYEGVLELRTMNLVQGITTFHSTCNKQIFYQNWSDGSCTFSFSLQPRVSLVSLSLVSVCSIWFLSFELISFLELMHWFGFFLCVCKKNNQKQDPIYMTYPHYFTPTINILPA